jgi:hypothetical protein
MSEAAEELRALRFGLENLCRGLTAMTDTLAVILLRLESVERATGEVRDLLLDGPEEIAPAAIERVSAVPA